jgi:signal transduction histidine kinase
MARTRLLGTDDVCVRRKLLSAVMLCSGTFSIGAVVCNIALGLGHLMTLFSVMLALLSFFVWAICRTTRIGTDRLAGLSVGMALVLLSGAWVVFEGGAGMAPPLVFWLLCLPLVFERTRDQNIAFAAVLVCTGLLSWVDLAHPELVQPYYETPIDRHVDVIISRMLSLLCCGVLLLRGKALYSQAVDRWRATEVERRRLIEQQALEASARRAEELEMIRSMSTGFAHDLSNLLSVMSHNAELLEEDLSTGMLDLEQARHDLAAIRTSAQAAVQLTQRLRASRAPRNSSEPPFPLVAFLEGQVELASKLAPGVEVDFEIRADGVEVLGRRALVEQIVLNLCLNAIQAMHGEGHILIRCDATEENVWIDVVDSGPGIPTDILPRVFEPHFTTRRAVGGTGLGLAMVREAAERMGGRIEVESILGVGTRFRTILPRARALRVAVA